MIPRKSVAWAWSIVNEPLDAMRSVVARPLEESIGKYLTLLVFSALVAGVVSFLWAFVRAAYFDVVRDVTIEYWRLLNYYGQVVMGTVFLYVFFGTFVLFLLTLFVHRFASDAKYVKAVAVTCASTAPLLLFGWVNYRVLVALLVWSCFLAAAGVKALREAGIPAQSTIVPSVKKKRSRR